MQTLGEIRSLLAERGLRPKHALGQNFLHDKNQLAKLVQAASILPGDLVLEVGPGTGTLTEALLEAGAEVIACEIDHEMASILADRLGERITLIVGDCLDKHRTLAPPVREALTNRVEDVRAAGRVGGFKLVANLPYQIASPLMAALLIDHAEQCRGEFVTIQKEVADRLLAQPGGKTYGPLGIIVQAFARVERIGTIPASCFWPAPKVTSAMISIFPSPSGRAVRGEGGLRIENDPSARRAFARFITEIFSKRRKQLGTILGRDAALPNQITPSQRPESLTVAQLIELWQLQRAK